MSKQQLNNIPYSEPLVALNNDLNNAKLTKIDYDRKILERGTKLQKEAVLVKEKYNLGIKFNYNRTSYKTLNFDIIFPDNNLKNTMLMYQKQYVEDFNYVKDDLNKLEELFNTNINVIEFLQNKNNIYFINNVVGKTDSEEKLSLKNNNEFTYEEEYFSLNKNIVARTFLRILQLLKREIFSNIIYLNNSQIITEEDLKSLNEENKYKLIFEKYLYLLIQIYNKIEVSQYTLINVLCICLASNNAILDFLTQYMTLLKNKNPVVEDNFAFMFSNFKEETSGIFKIINVNNYLNYFNIMFNEVDKISYIKNSIYINLSNENIIINKCNFSFFSVVPMDDNLYILLALVKNTETYNFKQNKISYNSQFVWTIDINSSNKISEYSELIQLIPYINKMILMTNNQETIDVFDKYNIKMPKWLLQREEEETNGYLENYEEIQNTSGGKRLLKIKNKTFKYKSRQKQKNKK
jgi:hypothetical protein